MTFRAFNCRHFPWFLILVLGVVLALEIRQARAQSPVQNTIVQSDQGTSSAAAETPSKEVDPATWKGVLDSTEQALTREGLTDSDLDKLLREVQRVEQEALAQIASEQDQLGLLRQRLDSLGPVPAEGEPEESPAAQEQRQALTEQFAAQDAKIKQATDAEVRARQLRERIANLRHERFFRDIAKRSPAIHTTEFWSRFYSGFSGFTKSLRFLASDSASVFVSTINASRSKLFGLLFLLPLILLVFVRGRRIMQKMRRRIPDNPTTRPVAGFAYYFQKGVLPAALIFALYGTFSAFGLLTPRLDQSLFAIAIAFSFFIVVRCLMRVVVAPFEPERRIIAVSDSMARQGYLVANYSLFVALALSILNSLAVVFVMPLQVKVGLSLLFCLVVAFASLWLLYFYRRDYLAEKQLHGSQSVPKFWRAFMLLLWGVSAAVLVLALAGYVAFAEFVAQQLVFGLVVIGSAWLLLRFVDFLFLHWSTEAAIEDGASEIAVAGSPGAGQFAILAAGISKLLIYLFATMLLMLPWGYRTRDFYQLIEHAFFGFEIGGLSVSVSTILLALALFFIGYSVTVALRSWLNDRLLPTTSLDIGISNSISTVFGYIGIFVAAMLAVSAAGFDLSNLAIVAGALSVGVGFGLQSIVNNFVSGLILLAERPIKAGDWVVTSGGTGIVKKISVRSTEIETFDRATVIVPNSNLITDNVTNWTHENKTGRIVVPIGVAYNSDPRQVEQILLDCAKSHKLILGRPEPVVFFMDFGANSLDFELRCFLSDINYALVVQSELRFQILEALRAANIGIPFPQREVLIKTEELPKSVEEAIGKTRRKR